MTRRIEHKGPGDGPVFSRPDTSERLLAERSRVESHDPGPADNSKFREITSPVTKVNLARDSAGNIGSIEGLWQLGPEGGAAEVAEILRQPGSFTVFGARTSLAGGSVARRTNALDMTRNKSLLGFGDNFITVQPGMTVGEIQSLAGSKDMHLASVPTYDKATAGGVVNTNAKGADTFLYGDTREQVMGLEVVLPNGRVLNLKRGEKFVHPDGYYEIVGENGRVDRIYLPDIQMPDLRKLSAGFYSKPGMGVIDGYIGNEGTTGVLTAITFGLIPKPHTVRGLIPCSSEEQAIKLNERLRNMTLETLRGDDPSGPRIAAIEYLDHRSLELLGEDGALMPGIDPSHVNSILFIQMPLDPESDEVQSRQLDSMLSILEEQATGLSDRSFFRMPNEDYSYFNSMREGVPDYINRRNERTNDELGDDKRRISKVAGDVIVPIGQFPEMIDFTRRTLTHARVDHAVFGHFSDAHIHPNAIPKSFEEYFRAKEAMWIIGLKAIDLGGSPFGEHGVGANEIKQGLLVEQYGIDGIEKFYRYRKSIDPKGKLNPNVLFKFP